MTDRRNRFLAFYLLLAIPLVSPGPLRGQDSNKAPLSPAQTSQFAKMLDEDWKDRPAWGEMAVMILKGEPMGSGQGWFTGSQRRHDWQWLAERKPQAASDQRIGPDEIPELGEADFARVDTDMDGFITPSDFLFEKNPFMEDASPAGSIFSKLDGDSNGRLTRDELEHWFERSTEGSEYLSVNDLKSALGLGPRPPRPRPTGQRPASDPRWKMMEMFLNGEMGSFSEGPSLNEDAPELDLPLVARSGEGTELKLTDRIVSLEDERERKPIVLIFGSFT